MGRLSTHVLDTVGGRPARAVKIELYALEAKGARRLLLTTQTNQDGRTDAPLLSGESFQVGRYELLFYIGEYFRTSGAAMTEPPFLDQVPIRFALTEPDGHYHVPLLATPWSYATYRGS